MELSPSWEVSSCKLLKNFSIIYGTRRFIPVFTRALHWLLCWAKSSSPDYPSCLSKIPFNIFSRLRLVLPSGLFPYGFPTTKPICIPLGPFLLHALLISYSFTWYSHYPWERVQVQKLKLLNDIKKRRAVSSSVRVSYIQFHFILTD
jgi:hypothetical protein